MQVSHIPRASPKERDLAMVAPERTACKGLAEKSCRTKTARPMLLHCNKYSHLRSPVS